MNPEPKLASGGGAVEVTLSKRPLPGTLLRIVPLILGVLACEPEGEPVRRMIRLDTLVFAEVGNGRGGTEDHGKWEIAHSPRLIVGGVAEGPGPLLFHDIRSATLLGDGRLAVADGGSQELRFFGQSGEFETAVGGVGDGPGEFRGLSWIDQCGTDSIYAYDFVHARISVYDEVGELARTFSVQPRGLGRKPYTLSCNNDGVLLVRGWPMIGDDQSEGPFRPEVSLALFNLDGEEVQYLGHLLGDEMYVWPRQIGPRPLGRVTVQALGAAV